MQLFFWGNEIVLYERAFKIAIFRETDKQLRDRLWQKALSLQLKKPLTQWKYISSCYCGVLLLISSWENTAANGTLVLSLTCMIFLYEECIGSAFTVLYFRWMMLFYVPVKLKLKHPSPGNSPGKFLFKFPPPEAEKLFKCPIIGPFQVIKCPPPPGNFSVAFIMLRKLCM